MIEAIGVIVPAHDEEELLGDCLASLDVAARRAGVPVHVAVVLDDCRDGSAEVVGRAVVTGGITTIRTDGRNVGRARAVGASALLARHREIDPAALWLATTDADSVVPPRWLEAQRMLADGEGADAVAGTVVVVDWADHPPEVPGHYHRLYGTSATVPVHDHVHGANLGVRAVGLPGRRRLRRGHLQRGRPPVADAPGPGPARRLDVGRAGRHQRPALGPGGRAASPGTLRGLAPPPPDETELEPTG